MQPREPTGPRQRRLLAGFTLASLLLLGCQGRDPALTLDDPRGFLGGVVADEPRAALVGSEILSAGGSAADAAIATYFALGVTLPSRAGISGGGMCLVYDPRLNRVDALDFLPRGTGPTAARGMFALHARSGRLRWEQLVAPAEGLARFGTPISRAFAGDLAESASTLSHDLDARRIFLRSDGAPRSEGDLLVQADLATVLAEIRARGPQALLAHMPTFQMVDARGATRVGAADDLQSGAPAWQPSLTVRHDGVAIHFAPSPSAAGASQAQMFTMMAERWRRTSAAERPNLIAEAGLRAASDREHGGDGTARMAVPSASFVAVDRDGGAVACTVTMNDAFGLGRVVPGTGVVLAAAPRGGKGGEIPAPMLALRARSGVVVFAGTASGGWPGAGALVDIALRTIIDGRRLDEAMSAARVHHTGAAGQVLVEGEGSQAGLASRGYAITTVPALGRVNAIFCPDGLSAEPSACQFAADRRGFGLAAGS